MLICIYAAGNDDVQHHAQNAIVGEFDQLVDPDKEGNFGLKEARDAKARNVTLSP